MLGLFWVQKWCMTFREWEVLLEVSLSVSPGRCKFVFLTVCLTKARLFWNVNLPVADILQPEPEAEETEPAPVPKTWNAEMSDDTGIMLTAVPNDPDDEYMDFDISEYKPLAHMERRAHTRPSFLIFPSFGHLSILDVLV